MGDSTTSVVPMVVPPTDRPAIEEPLLIQAWAAAKRDGLHQLVPATAWVVGGMVLHWVLDSPVTGATLLVYAIPAMLMVGVAISGIRQIRTAQRNRRWLGESVWQWIAPQQLRFHGRTVAFDLDDQWQAQLRVATNAEVEITRHYGVWTMQSSDDLTLVRTAGSLRMRTAQVSTVADVPGESPEFEPDHRQPAARFFIGSLVAVVLFELDCSG